MCMSIALTNLGKYNEGILDFVWLNLPATDDEIAAAFDKIEVSHDDTHYYSDGRGRVVSFDDPEMCGEYEEFFITDYECDFYRVSEYENLDSLNEMAETIDDLQDYEMDIVKALIDDGYTLEQALDAKDDCIYWDDCDSMTDVAYRMLDEYGDLDRIPEDLRDYFDYEAYGRNLETGGHFISTDTGYIEVLR